MDKLSLVFIFLSLFIVLAEHHQHHRGHLHLNLTQNDDQGLQVNCKENRFDLNGHPFHYIAGEVHYFRIPRKLWNDRLYRMRALGLNVAQVYVAWNWHEEQEGVYNFKGDRDLAEFIRLAQKNDLYVNLRIGPYICAEWEMGGLPWWLLKYDGIQLRDNKGPFLDLAKRFLKRVVDEIKDLQYPGPILMVQVENEYGSYGKNHEYMDSLATSIREYGIDKALLYTTDGFDQVKNGFTLDAYPTVDFGVSNSLQVDSYFEKQRNVSKCGPSVNSEFYTGWFDSWGSSRSSYPSAKQIIDTANYMVYNHNASFSFYMAHGGTNFGFWEGGEIDATIITSYDYGSPITEAGQITDNYLAIRRFIKKIPNWNNRPFAVPENHTSFNMSGIVARRLNKSLPQLFLNLKKNCKNVREPENFEKFNQSFGYAIYSHEFKGNTPKHLFLKFFRDLAYVFIGDEYQGVLGNCSIDLCRNRDLALNSNAKGPLYIIVENLGRLNFNHGLDYKGIRSSVVADGETLTEWTECGVDLNRLPRFITNFVANEVEPFDKSDSSPALGIYLSTFNISLPNNGSDIGAYTYFDGSNWGKGQLILNNYNVGRYWSSAGPQRSIYVPGVFFKNNAFNRAILINFEPQRPIGTLSLVNELTWNKPFNSRGLQSNRRGRDI